MTDKQIIIDGVDVSGCIYYEDGKCLNGEIMQCNCKNVAVCYYKEYKRKEQECERLKNERTIDLVKQLDQLKAENEILKNEIEYDSCYNDMQAEIDCGEKIISQLKQTLTDIKELCQKHIKAEKIVMANDILQKITECEAVDD